MSSENLARQKSIEEMNGYLSDPPHIPGSDASSQFSKESNRKKKGWTKSLKKATNSILYMAMPPTSADQMPMVVAQTPMSPDRLIPALHSPLLQAPLMSALESTSSLASTVTTTVPFTPGTAASSTSSIGSSSMASSSSTKHTTPRGSKTEYYGPINSEHSDTTLRKQRSLSSSSEPRKRSVKGKERAGSIDSSSQPFEHAPGSEPVDAMGAMPLTSPASSPPSRPPPKHSNGANPTNAASLSSMIENASQPDGQQVLPSPPPSPSNVAKKRSEASVKKEKRRIQSTANSDNAAEQVPSDMHSWDSSKQIEVKPTVNDPTLANASVLPMLPPNLSRLSFALGADPEHKEEQPQGSGKKSLVTHAEETSQEIAAEETKEQVNEDEAKKTKEETRPIHKATTITSIPGSFPGLSFSGPEPIPEAALPESFPTRPKYKTPRPPRESMPYVPLPGSFPVKPVLADPEPIPEPVAIAPPPESPVIASPPESCAIAPLPEPSPVVPQPQVEEPKPIPIATPIAPQSEPSHVETPVEERPQMPEPAAVSPSISRVPSVSNTPIVIPREASQRSPFGSRNQSSEISTEMTGVVAIPRRPLPLSISENPSNRKTVKNVPWLWHQDGIHQQRLESHQILTKEQVFEQFHLDLEQEGPNGFFLFKLVKRFKKQDPSLLAISSSLLDAELSASPSSSPTNATPSSILESLEAVSVSQRLKRQLLLQKRKKQRKSSISNDDDESNLEALLAMSNNNISLQNLNSSLQEVIEAVEHMKVSEEWTSLLSQPGQLAQLQPQSQKPSYPDSDGEYTSRDKDAADIAALEKRRGVYATGRLDGMNLISKKKLVTAQRRPSAAQRRPSTAGNGRKGSVSSSASSGVNGADVGAQDIHGNERRGSEGGDVLQFKKTAVAQLHIYSRNGLKFKFDVMEDNELHFVEASKKYTFMDPLAAHRQPDLDANSTDGLSPLRSPSSSRRLSNGTVATASDVGRAPRRSNSSMSKSTLSSTGSASSRRVYVTRLGRHTLLTYPEYKALAKSASSFTLGAKLLIQRSIAVATPNFYGNGHGKDSSQASANGNAASASPTRSNLTPTPSGKEENVDYFSVKKKPRGLASKAVAAIKSPLTPSGANQQKSSPRPIVTPYNPNDYKNKPLTVLNSANGNSSGGEESTSPPTTSYTPLAEVDTNNSDSSPFPLPPNHINIPPEALSPLSSTPTTPSVSSPPPTPSSSGSNSYGSIKRQGNQAGIKFQHLFVTVHQRLQKLELDNGSSFYGSALVQWTVIEDPAELRWWRDKIGIQMIGRLDGDESVSSPAAKTSSLSDSNRSTLSSVRASFMSSDSMISDATSSLSSRGYRTHISVERLGYRFLRVSGHMGTLKVTVSEKVEARAVALAVRAEMIKQKRMAHMNQGYPGHIEDLLEQPWVESEDTSVVSDGDSGVDGYDCDEDNNESENETTESNGLPIKKSKDSPNSYDGFEYDEWTGQTKPKAGSSVDRFSRRKRHNRGDKGQEPLIERTTMIVCQSKVFKGDWYMKNVYKFYPEK
ncbi:hypothetical protein BGX21_010616 [Mortierella sp. AD011]|nr:hypothetical protein BGX20_003604 [Mortierella sp. AD010]KAF9393810.1 hypothetical protein BGX21_010616 [Mortierella sp. AD011]